MKPGEARVQVLESCAEVLAACGAVLADVVSLDRESEAPAKLRAAYRQGALDMFAGILYREPDEVELSYLRDKGLERYP